MESLPAKKKYGQKAEPSEQKKKEKKEKKEKNDEKKEKKKNKTKNDKKNKKKKTKMVLTTLWTTVSFDQQQRRGFKKCSQPVDSINLHSVSDRVVPSL